MSVERVLVHEGEATGLGIRTLALDRGLALQAVLPLQFAFSSGGRPGFSQGPGVNASLLIERQGLGRADVSPLGRRSRPSLQLPGGHLGADPPQQISHHRAFVTAAAAVAVLP